MFTNVSGVGEPLTDGLSFNAVIQSAKVRAMRILGHAEVGFVWSYRLTDHSVGPLDGGGSPLAETLFLDRDGVINEDSPDFIKSVDEWVPIPGSLDAIARLTAADFRIVVVTNQSGIARGLLSDTILTAIHQRMIEEIRAFGGRLAGVYFCPHGPEDGCDCRKPRPGLIDRACRDLGLEARDAPLIGDRMSDLCAARAAGCRPIFVRNGCRMPARLTEEAWRDIEIHDDLAAVADRLLGANR